VLAVPRRIKSESGHQFTSRLEGMFRDVEVSRVNTEEFHAQEVCCGTGACVHTGQLRTQHTSKDTMAQ
jgi:hypothetical protein